MCLSSNQQGNDHFGPPPCCGVGPLAAFGRTRSAASPLLAVCAARRRQDYSTFYSDPAVTPAKLHSIRAHVATSSLQGVRECDVAVAVLRVVNVTASSFDET